MKKTIAVLLVFFLGFLSCKKNNTVEDILKDVTLIATFIASDYEITKGESTSLILGVLLADEIWIDKIGKIELGTVMIDVSPTETTTYTLTVSYKTKKESKSLTINVKPAIPTGSIKMWVNPAKIKENESATVYWEKTWDDSSVSTMLLNWVTTGIPNGNSCGDSGRGIPPSLTSYSEAFKMYCTSVNEVAVNFKLVVTFKSGQTIEGTCGPLNIWR